MFVCTATRVWCLACRLKNETSGGACVRPGAAVERTHLARCDTDHVTRLESLLCFERGHPRQRVIYEEYSVRTSFCCRMAHRSGLLLLIGFSCFCLVILVVCFFRHRACRLQVATTTGGRWGVYRRSSLVLSPLRCPSTAAITEPARNCLSAPGQRRVLIRPDSLLHFPLLSVSCLMPLRTKNSECVSLKHYRAPSPVPRKTLVLHRTRHWEGMQGRRRRWPSALGSAKTETLSPLKAPWK